MYKRLILRVLAIALLISSITPQQVNASTSNQELPPAHGEIAFVRDGDIWLYNLATGLEEQLTEDGNNRLPAWSEDGRFLLWTHDKGMEQSDVYIWELGVDEPRMLVEDACCAGWEVGGERIAFVSFTGEGPAVKTTRIDGITDEVLSPSLKYGQRDAWPTRNISWGRLSGIEQAVLVSVEALSGSAESGFSISNRVLFFSEDSSGNLGALENCSQFHQLTVRSNELIVAYSGDLEGYGCEDGLGRKGVWVKDAISEAEFWLPWLAYPSFDADGDHLVAESYRPADDPADATLTGTVMVDWRSDERTELIEDGSQPAWRPTLPIPAALSSHVQPGEQVVTLEPALMWQGTRYTVHYLATGNYTSTSPRLFAVADANSFEEWGITALFVERDDGTLVTDADEIRQILLLYRAAYTLYEEQPAERILELGDDLDLILNNPLFVAMEPKRLLPNRQAQTEEALRAILTDNLTAEAQAKAVMNQVFQEDPTRVEDALDAFNTVVQEGASGAAEVGDDLAAVYDEIDSGARWGGRASTAMRFVLKLLFISDLQAERADWLSSYIDEFSTGSGSLNRTQLRAAVQVLDEVGDAREQRVDIAQDVIFSETFEAAVDAGEKAVQAALTQLAARAGEGSGAKIAANSVSGALATISIGLTVNGILYGSDALVDNFLLAKRAEELRFVFRDGRTSIQAQADDDAETWDGDLAEAFRAAWLLENMAAVQSQRAYADGIAATYLLPNPAQLINWLRGEDWKETVDDLNELADETELQLVETFIIPDWLAVSAISDHLTEITGNISEGRNDYSPLESPWTLFSASQNIVYDLVVDANELWVATSSGAILWDLSSGTFIKYTTFNGLTDNQVDVILKDKNGSIWFGTGTGGLNRLNTDGTWTYFSADDVLAANNISSAIETDDGSFWFGTRSGGASKLSPDGTWTTFSTENGLVDNYVESIFQSADGAIWFGTGNGASRLNRDGEWTAFSTEDGLVGNYVTSILQDADNAIWFATNSGVSQLSVDGVWNTYTAEDGLVSNDVKSMFQSEDGTLWFSSYDGLGVSQLNTDGTWQTLSEEDGLPNNIVTVIKDGTSNSLWFGTGGDGVGELKADGTWDFYMLSNTIDSNQHPLLLQSRDGSLWVGTAGGGVSRLTPDGTWVNVTQNSSYLDDYSAPMLESNDGALWFRTQAGVSRLSTNGEWRVFSTENGLADNQVYSALQSTDGAIWFGTQNGASRFIEPEDWTTFTTGDGLSANQIFSIEEANDGTLWFGTLAGVSRFDTDENWTFFRTNEGLGSDVVIDILQASTGDIWFATITNLDTYAGGVSRLDRSGNWTIFTTADGLSHNDVHSVMETADGALWFGTEDGVNRLGSDGTWTFFAMGNVPHISQVNDMLQDTDGKLWFAESGVGVIRLDYEQWLEQEGE